MEYEKSKHELNVLCVGLARTGTSSLKIALESLFELDLAPVISKILSGDMSDDEVKNMFEKYKFCAAKGFPFLAFWERTLELYPNSKVILTVRDPESLVKSMKNTVMDYLNGYHNRFPNNLFHRLPFSWNRSLDIIQNIPLHSDMFEAIESGRGVDFFNNWVEHVKSKVSKDRLLIYKVKDGWEPLCKFLKKPIPDMPFPKTNDTKSFKEDYLGKQMRIKVLTVMTLAAIPLAAIMSTMAFKFSDEIMSSFKS